MRVGPPGGGATEQRTAQGAWPGVCGASVRGARCAVVRGGRCAVRGGALGAVGGGRGRAPGSTSGRLSKPCAICARLASATSCTPKSSRTFLATRLKKKRIQYRRVSFTYQGRKHTWAGAGGRRRALGGRGAGAGRTASGESSGYTSSSGFVYGPRASISLSCASVGMKAAFGITICRTRACERHGRRDNEWDWDCGNSPRAC